MPLVKSFFHKKFFVFILQDFYFWGGGRGLWWYYFFSFGDYMKFSASYFSMFPEAKKDSYVSWFF